MIIPGAQIDREVSDKKPSPDFPSHSSIFNKSAFLILLGSCIREDIFHEDLLKHSV